MRPRYTSSSKALFESARLLKGRPFTAAPGAAPRQLTKSTSKPPHLYQELVRMARGENYQRSIYIFENINTGQVVYSLNPDLLATEKHAKRILDQITFVGKGTVPREIRRDLWKSLATVHFDNQDLCLIAYKKLREYRQLREYSWRQNYSNLKFTKTKQEKELAEILKTNTERIDKGETTEAQLREELATKLQDSGTPFLLDTDIEAANFRYKKESQRPLTATKHSRHLQKWLQDRKKFLMNQKGNSIADLASVLKTVDGLESTKGASIFLQKQNEWLNGPKAEFDELKEMANKDKPEEVEKIDKKLKHEIEVRTAIYKRGKSHPTHNTSDRRHALRTTERRYNAVLSLREARDARKASDEVRAEEIEAAVLRGCNYQIHAAMRRELKTLDTLKHIAVKLFTAGKLMLPPQSSKHTRTELFKSRDQLDAWLNMLGPRPPIAPGLESNSAAFREFLRHYKAGKDGLEATTREVSIEWADQANSLYVREEDWPLHVKWTGLKQARADMPMGREAQRDALSDLRRDALDEEERKHGRVIVPPSEVSGALRESPSLWNRVKSTLNFSRARAVLGR